MKLFNYLVHACAAVGIVTSFQTLAVEYPSNQDYGTKGEFLAKRGTEYGRTAILMPVGPILINLPEAPGTTSTTFIDPITGEPLDGITLNNRTRDSAWDLSDLTNPSLYRQLTCDTDDCHPGMPIAAHATVVRFDPNKGPLLYGRNSGDLSHHPELAGTDGELNTNENYWDWGYDPIAYVHMTAPYYIRSYWNYGFDNQGQYIIRDSSKHIEGGPINPWSVEGNPELEALFGPTNLGVWLGEPIVHWDHLAATGVTGFPTWLGNLLVVASDQQSTGLAVYDVSGFKQGRLPRLLSVYNEQRTEPSGNTVGVGGYWVEAYGASKMVYSARALDGIDVPKRDYPSLFIVDFLDPENPKVTCEIFFDQDENNDSDGDGSSDPMYVNFQDEYAYVDHFQVNMALCETLFEDGQIDAQEFDQIVYKFDDIANQCDGSQYFRPIGQVGIFGGYDWWVTDDVNEQGMCFFVTSDEPDTRAPYVAGHRPLAEQVGVPIDTFIHVHIPETLRTETVENAVSVTNLTTNESIDFRYQLAHTGMISIWPNENLAANTQYQVSVSGIQDFMGNTMQDYQFSFTTNDGDLLNGATPGIPVTPPEPDAEPSYSGVSYFPTKSSQISCAQTEQNQDVWVVNPDNDTIAIITSSFHSDTLEKTHSYKMEINLGYETPTSITQTGELKAVTYQNDDKVVFFNTDGQPQFSIDTGHGTQPINLVSQDGFVYVALYASGEVIKINVSTKQIVQRLYLGSTPKAMALNGDRLLVTRFISALDHGSVYDVDISQNMSLTRTITVNKILVPDDIDHGSGVPNYLRSIVIDSAGEFAYITANKANTDRGSRAGSTNSEALDDDNTVRSIIVTLDLTNNIDSNIDATSRDNAIDLDNVSDPAGITYLVNEQINAISLQGNNVVLVTNAENNTTARFRVGGAPQEMCSNLRTLYVKNFTDRSISAIDISSYLNQGDINPNVETISTVATETLSAEELKGLQVFYHSSIPQMGNEGYMSCASCHDGAGHDGRTWDITSLGEGLRNTISLNGSNGTRFGNLHWSGNFDEVQDFELQIERLNGGDGLVQGQTFGANDDPISHVSANLSNDLDALAAYINGLGKQRVKHSPYRTYNGDLTDSASRGQQVFTDKNCNSCHQSDAFRDGNMHDVGTITAASGNRLGAALTAIRTPTLIELWDSAPYFHNGQANSIDQVLNTADHKVELTEQEKADLIQYLLSIDRKLYVDDIEL
ncbi:Ig-like domain-containing protein [Catenovulum maritimum]|uniref:Cytochrome c domain-containing protein n=1 Tax=Catenovulum maritimum TaxID=1513271 RepID=A0A0J8H1C3_9ALTE|nr:Ig-like domain-containing protein [Catenovulum maritimum]KMT66823.1 hypothetical protein XM47_01530 [Catenovulum maritimum]